MSIDHSVFILCNVIQSTIGIIRERFWYIFMRHRVGRGSVLGSAENGNIETWSIHKCPFREEDVEDTEEHFIRICRQ